MREIIQLTPILRARAARDAHSKGTIALPTNPREAARLLVEVQRKATVCPCDRCKLVRDDLLRQFGMVEEKFSAQVVTIASELSERYEEDLIAQHSREEMLKRNQRHKA